MAAKKTRDNDAAAANSTVVQERAGADINGNEVANLLVFQLRGRTWSLPLEAVDFVHPLVEVTAAPGAPSVVAGIVDVHGKPVPVFDLSRRMDGTAGEYGLDARLIIGRTSRRPFAILAHAVDSVLALPRSKMASMTELVPGIGQVPGVAAAPDGLIYIHDPETALSASEEADLNAAMARARG